MDAAPTTKTCSKCNEEKPLDEFYKSKINIDGHDGYCKECRKAVALAWSKNNQERKKVSDKQWIKDNPEKKKAINKRYYDTHPEASRRWEKNNPEQTLAACKKYRENNPAKRAALQARRKAAKIQRTPLWADKNKILEVYEEARALQEATGEPYHVDHIYPLRGKQVSGLHVDYNLRAVPASVNLTKSNSFNPDEHGS